MKTISHSFAFAVALAAAVTSLLAGCAIDKPPPEDTAQLALVQQVMQLVQRDYVSDVDHDQLLAHALKGMLRGLDPHSDYMDEAEYRSMQADLRGKFGGVGLQLAVKNGMPQVVAALDGTPAARAGIDPGDVIAAIDGQPTAGLSTEDIVERLRGPAGTQVALKITRGDRPAHVVTLRRAVIDVASVKFSLEPGAIGYVRIGAFGENAPADFAKALERLRSAAGRSLRGLVLDLRDNPGGLMGAAVDVASDLLDGGTVLVTRGRRKEDGHVYTVASHGDRLPGAPVVVLINGGSASASEIVAGALQDRHRATIMGTRSFGKGSVQTIIPLDGHGAARLTTARYYTPSGRSIQDTGIVPDVKVAVPANDRSTAAGTSLARESDLPGALRNTGPLEGAPGGRSAPAAGAAAKRAGQGAAASAPSPGAPVPAEESDNAPIKPALIGTERDAQLAAALQFLQAQLHDADAAPAGVRSSSGATPFPARDAGQERTDLPPAAAG